MSKPAAQFLAFALLAATAAAGACAPGVAAGALPAPIRTPPTTAPVQTYSYEIVNRFPHDPEAFTQGLVYCDGVFYESTGLNGESSLRKVRLETGEVLQRQAIDGRYFAEGLAAFGGELFQLTWVSGVGFVYDRESFAPRRRFSYHGEGWGLTHDGTRFIMSDGTPVLRFLDPMTMKETGRVRVTDGGVPVDDLNELEYVGGRVYANVWLTDRIAIIDPVSGQVTGWIDLAGLTPNGSSFTNAVLNGIAYDAAHDRLFVTGKLWPTVFEIRLIPRVSAASGDDGGAACGPLRQ